MILNGSGPLRALHDRVRSPQARRRGVDSDQATAWLMPRLRSCCSVTSRGLGKPDNTSFARHKTHAKHSTGTCKVERTSSCVMPDATSPISATSNRAATAQRRVGRGGGEGGGAVETPRGQCRLSTRGIMTMNATRSGDLGTPIGRSPLTVAHREGASHALGGCKVDLGDG